MPIGSAPWRGGQCIFYHTGPIYPVNPRHADNVTGVFDRLPDLPETVAHVVLAVATARLEACLVEAVAAWRPGGDAVRGRQGGGRQGV